MSLVKQRIRGFRGDAAKPNRQNSAPCRIYSEHCLQTHYFYLDNSDITSQNHRMAEPGRDHWSSCLKPPAPAGPPRANCQGPCPDEFWASPRMQTPQPPWAYCAQVIKIVFLVIHRVKRCFLMIRVNILCSSLCPVPLAPALGTVTGPEAIAMWQSLAHYTPSLQVFTDEIFLNLFSRSSCPFITLVARHSPLAFQFY